MKKSNLILGLLLASVCVFAQNPFSRLDYNSNQPVLFDSLGNISDTSRHERIESNIPPITINPRVDDVVWSKVVLRVVDLTEKQNYPLYFPLPKDSIVTDLNLFTLMYGKILSKELVAYQDTVNLGESAPIVPHFTEANICDPAYILRSKEDFKYYVNPDNGKMTVESYTYYTLAAGVTKYLLQEVWFFDKSTSQTHQKILAICPVYFDFTDGRQTNLFWVPFDKLRVFLSQEIINASSRNNAQLMTYDDFFAQNQHASYLFKDNNIYDRTLQSYLVNSEEVKREQSRIENEMLNFEQDLWEY